MPRGNWRYLPEKYMVLRRTETAGWRRWHCILSMMLSELAESDIKVRKNE